MIRYQRLSEGPQISRWLPIVGLFRFYAAPSDDPMADYVGVCTVVERATTVELVGMHGAITRQHLIEMARWFHSRGVVTVFADRSRGRRLPLFNDEGFTLISDWIERFGP